MCIGGDAIYIASIYGLHYIDVSNPAYLTDKYIYRIYHDDYFWSPRASMYGNAAVICGFDLLDKGLEILEISGGQNVKFLGRFSTPGYPKKTYISGAYLYVCDLFSAMVYKIKSN